MIKKIQIFKNDYHEFKPILNEIEDQPLNPIGRFILWIILFAILFIGIWLYMAKIDIVVSSRGKVVSQTKGQKIMTSAGGVVSEVYCYPGDFVKKGQPLLKIKPNKEQESEDSDQEKVIFAPVDGYIDNSFIPQIGSHITDKQKLFIIRPANSSMLIETYVTTKDVGFIAKGMTAAIKVDAFNYQQYGLLTGQIQYITNIESSKLGPVFKVGILPLEKCLTVEGEKKCLVPGFTVTSDVVIGKRRVIEFFIYPLVKYLNEGFNVR